MKDFDYEVLQRKRLASQARYRKNGSKSKKCSLPSDGMSHKQWKERNGEVMEYNLSKPMSWKAFTKMPLDLQRKYLENLRDKYEVTATAVAEQLFDIQATSFWAYRKRHDMLDIFPRNGGKHASELFDTFLNPELAVQEVADEPCLPVQEEPCKECR